MTTMPHNETMGARVMKAFRIHQGEWLTANDVSRIVGDGTPSEIGGHIRVLSATTRGFERIVLGSRRRVYRYREAAE